MSLYPDTQSVQNSSARYRETVFLNVPLTTDMHTSSHTLSLHDALPISLLTGAEDFGGYTPCSSTGSIENDPLSVFMADIRPLLIAREIDALLMPVALAASPKVEAIDPVSCYVSIQTAVS